MSESDSKKSTEMDKILEKHRIVLGPLKVCSHCHQNEIRCVFSRLIPSLCQDCAEEEIAKMLQQIKCLIDELLKNFNKDS